MSSSNFTVVNATEFNATDVKYGKPKLNKSNGKSVAINFAGDNRPLHLSTPLLLTWGAQKFVDEKKGDVSFSMSLQFPSDDYATETSTRFLENFKALEKKIKADAITNSKEWLNKPKISEEVVDALFTPMLKYPKDKQTGDTDYTRSPTINIKIPCYDQKFGCEVYDTNNQLLFPTVASSEITPIELIQKGTNVLTLIQCGGLWFANGKFGCTWRLCQAVVQPKANMRGVCLVKGIVETNSSTSSTSTSSTSTNSNVLARTSTNVGLEIAEDSDAEDTNIAVSGGGGEDDEGDDEEVVEFSSAQETPTPTPTQTQQQQIAEDGPASKVVKKIVRKVKA
jgi:hypothetical protein